MGKKKRTKNKKKSGGETKARRAEKTKEREEKTEVKAEAKAKAAEEAEDAEEAEEEAEEVKAEAKEEAKPKKKEAKAKKKDKARETAILLSEATVEFEAGRYRTTRTKLLAMLDKSPTPEEREQAQELLGNMEMDVRTLMVGAVSMVTLLLIPALGYTNFAKALWTIPVLFLLLIVDPRLFRSPGTTASDEK